MSDQKPGSIDRLTELVAKTTPLILALGTLVTAISSVGALTLGIINSAKINQVHDLTNSLATKAQVLSREVGQAEGEIKGRIDEQVRKAIEDTKKPEPKR